MTDSENLHFGKTVMSGIFKPYDIRGSYPDEMN
jgi:hypothetical protein